MKQFDIPDFYRSPLISKVKNYRKSQDAKKKDFSPTLLDFGSVRFLIARHFGFCYGVENAIEIAYRALAENQGKNIYLLSQMIHNPDVNSNLLENGIQFLQDTEGNQLIPFGILKKEDIVIIPAFGASMEIMEELTEIGVDIHKYNTTCPFVEKVWNRSQKLGEQDYTIIIHGKAIHEETRATFSHSSHYTPSVVVKDMNEATILTEIIMGKRPSSEFSLYFSNKSSKGFNPESDLNRVGVVNQTTMLASETQDISNLFKETMKQKYGEHELKSHFADTRDTLCYATNDNQNSTLELLTKKADLAIVIGGHNSSNTTHLVELLEQKFPTFFIRNEKDMENRNSINHFDIHIKEIVNAPIVLPENKIPTIIVTSGASCPDSMVDQVIQKLLFFFQSKISIEEAINNLSIPNN